MPRLPNSKRNNENISLLLFTAGQAPTKKNFTLTIPPVPNETFGAIASRISKTQPWIGKKAKLDFAQHKAKKLDCELNLLKEKLEDLEYQRKRKVQEIQNARELELKENLAVLEKKTKHSYHDLLSEKEKLWNEERKKMMSQMEEELSTFQSGAEEELKKEEKTEQEKVDRREEESSDCNKKEALMDQGMSVSENIDSTTEDIKKLSSVKREELFALRQKAEELRETKKDMGKLLVMIMKAEKKKKEEIVEKGRKVE